MCVQYLAAALFFEFDFHCVVPPISSLWCTAAAAVSHSFAFLNRGHERLFRQLLLRARPFSVWTPQRLSSVLCTTIGAWRCVRGSGLLGLVSWPAPSMQRNAFFLMLALLRLGFYSKLTHTLLHS